MNNKKILAAALAAMALSSYSCSDVVGSNAPPLPPPNTFAGAENKTTTTEAAVTEISTLPTETSSETPSDPSQSPSSVKLRGNIYDVNGKLLASTDTSTERRVYATDYAVPFANVISEMSEGFDTAFYNNLTAKNPTAVGDGNVGQSIALTIDADKQKKIYEYMQSVNLDGTVVVMRTDGSLLAQVNYPSYDPNAVAEQKYDQDLAWGECGNKAFQNFPPGSCFKIMSEVIADKHGVTSLYDEGKWEYEGVSIVNWDHDKNPYYPMQRTLSSAFVNSSNIFFAKAFDQIGTTDVLNDLESIFHFCSDIECDFGPLENNIEINCNDDLRRTAFGQSYIMTCPIYLAALGREAVFGDMVRPFVLKNTVDTATQSILGQGSKSGDVICSIPEAQRQNLLDGMRGVASNLGVYVPSGYTLYAKTGTAETWKGDFLYITGCVKKDGDNGSSVSDYGSYDGSYVIIMEVQNPAAHGFSFASDSAKLYQGIINTLMQ